MLLLDEGVGVSGGNVLWGLASWLSSACSGEAGAPNKWS